MNHAITTFVFAGVAALALAGCSQAMPSSGESARSVASGGAANPALDAAHDSYLRGDWVTMGERIRDVLVDPRSTWPAKENALEVLDKAFEVNDGELPSRFHSPPAVKHLQYVSRRFVTPGGGSKFQIRFAGWMKDTKHLVGLTVRHLPDGLVMDKKSGRGEFAVRHDPPSQQWGLEEFVLDSPPLDAPLGDGVVSIRLELDDGTVSEGFVIARGLGSLAPPTVVSPAPSESVADGNPVLRWTASERLGTSFARGRTVVYVARAGEDAAAWFYARENALSGEVRIGSADGAPTTTLAPGSYVVFVSPGELRHFGAIEVGRATRVSRAFHVVAR